MTSPVFAVLSMMIKSESPGAVIFKHKRRGIRDSVIEVYKFRSMYTGSEDLEKNLNDDDLEVYYREYRLKNDPRVTRIGRNMRRACLDELPQLINVLRGDMSLVGPRPITEEELSFYNEEEAVKLLSIRPGLTGYWQVYGRGTANYRNGERQKMELFYVDNASIKLDITILIRTPAVVLQRMVASDD